MARGRIYADAVLALRAPVAAAGALTVDTDPSGAYAKLRRRSNERRNMELLRRQSERRGEGRIHRAQEFEGW